MNLIEMTNELKTEKRGLEHEIYRLIDDFQKKSGLEIKEIIIIREQLNNGAFILTGVKMATDL